MTRSNPGDRIERLLTVAAHPTTPYHEAMTALEGARRIVVRFDLGGIYGLRVAGIALQLASRNAAASLAPLPASMAIAIKEFQKIRDME